MPIYSFKSPDGKTYDITAPDGATKEEAFAVLQKQIEGSATAIAKPSAADIAAADPTKGNNFAENALIGAGKGFHDLGQGVAQRVRGLLESVGGKDVADQFGLTSEKDVAASRKIDAPLMKTAGGKTGDFVAKAATSLPAMAIPGAQGFAGAALTGAGMSAIEPTIGDESVMKNAALGAAGGAAGYGAVKTIGAGLNAVKAAAQPFYDAGKNAIVGKAIVKAAGTDADLAAARAGLDIAQSGVPGVELTAGQAAGNAGIAALERAASATNPTVTQAYANRMASQNAARVGVLEDMSGAGGARDFFAADRDAVASGLYDAAFSQGIDPAAMTPYVKNQVTQLLKRPSIQDAMAQAKRLAAESGVELGDDTSIQGLHYAKMALDDKIAESVRAGTNTLTHSLMGTKEMLSNVMDKLSPAYGEARRQFAAMSRPVNQMDVAGEIVNKSVNKLTGNLQPNAFANALTDATAKRATGFNKASLNGTMDVDQLASLGAIKDDLARAVFAQNAGRGVGSDTVQKLAYSNMLDSSGLPNFVGRSAPLQTIAGVAGRFSDAAYGRANKELSERLAESLLDTSKTSGIIDAALRSIENSNAVSNAASTIAPYAAGAAIAAPSVINDTRQPR